MLERNNSLISLDLRDNPGFASTLSKIIFKRLVNNKENYKEFKRHKK